MKKLLLAALVAGSAFPAVSVASHECQDPEHPVPAPVACQVHERYVGGCGFVAVSDPTLDGNLGGQGAFTGEVDWQVVLVDPADPRPLTGTVWCELEVNGVVQDATVPTSVTIAGAGADLLTYTKASDYDVVALCTVIEWDLPDVRDCGTATTTTIPPYEPGPDPTLCEVLRLLAPGVPGVVDVNDQGDIWLAGDGFFDCPPYGDVFD